MDKLFYLPTKIIWALFLLFQLLSFNQAYSDQNIVIIDGDSFLLDNTEWRLWGIDAPELFQTCKTKNSNQLITCGEDAKNKLISLMIKPIDCELKDIDQYKRKLGLCKNAKGTLINAEMVKSGQAFDYRRYSDFFFDKEEKEAKKIKIGIWQTNFIWPWHWRRENSYR